MWPPVDTNKSGGTRYSTGKPSGFWYAPIYGLRLIAPIWEHGAEKYAPMDWKEGQDYSSLIDCMFRHVLEVVERGPWAKDPDSGELHLAHAAWNVLCLLTFMALGREELNDVDKWRGVTAAMKKEAESSRRFKRFHNTGAASYVIESLASEGVPCE